MDLPVIVILALAVGAILVVLGKFNKPAPTASIGYRLRGPLFTPAERSFLGVLKQAVPDEYLVLGKVRVADVITPERGLTKSMWQSAFNKINSKHFDYVVCDKATLKVLSAVELNDKSHKGKKRLDRDAFLRDACFSAGLRLIEFEARSSYSVVEVRERLAAEEDDA